MAPPSSVLELKLLSQALGGPHTLVWMPSICTASQPNRRTWPSLNCFLCKLWASPNTGPSLLPAHPPGEGESGLVCCSLFHSIHKLPLLQVQLGLGSSGRQCQSSPPAPTWGEAILLPALSSPGLSCTLFIQACFFPLVLGISCTLCPKHIDLKNWL